MRKTWIACALLLVCTATCFGQVPVHLQNVSVTIHAADTQGSGVVKVRDHISYVWTAAHVIENLKRRRKVVDQKTGIERIIIEFSDAQIVQECYEDGRSVGYLQLDAEVLRYSDPTEGEDLALLRVRKRDMLKESATFSLDRKPTAVGTELYHCGSLHGQMGSNSVTTGILSQVGRVLDNRVFDQTTCAAFRGSSGGGIYTRDGKYIGMLVRGAGETFNLIVPTRRILDWSERVGVRFALDDEVSVPSEKELKSHPIEELDREFKSAYSERKP